ELVTVDLGRSLGLYATLSAGPQTAPALAAATGINARYAREWLEQQAVAGILEVANDGDGVARRFSLPVEHAVALLEEESLAYIGAISGIPESMSKTIDALRDAFRSGGGVPYAAYEIHDLQAAF